MIDQEYRYLFHWGITFAGGCLLLIWGYVLLFLENRSRKNSGKDSLN